MDFRAIIASELAKGTSPEDLVKAFTETLNEAEAVNKSKEEKNEYLRQLRQYINDDIRQANYTFKVAAEVATIAAAAKNPDWTLDYLKTYCSAVEKALPLAIETGDFIVKFEDDSALGELLDKLVERWNSLFDDDDGKIKAFLRGI